MLSSFKSRYTLDLNFICRFKSSLFAHGLVRKCGIHSEFFNSWGNWAGLRIWKEPAAGMSEENPGLVLVPYLPHCGVVGDYYL